MTATKNKKAKAAETKTKPETTKKGGGKKKEETTATATASRLRSPLVKDIMNTLQTNTWTSREALTKAVGKHINKEDALFTYQQRGLKKNDTTPEKGRIARGKEIVVMLTCITLVQQGKIEQQGRGDTKEYRLAPEKKAD